MAHYAFINHYHQPNLSTSSNYKTETNKYQITKCQSDGNCFFRAISHQIYGHQEEHLKLRAECCDHLRKNKESFSAFVTEDYNKFVDKMEKLNEWVDHVAMLALAQVYHKNIIILKYSKKEKEYCEFNTIEVDNESLENFMISYHNGKHYNSVMKNTRRQSNEKVSINTCQCTLQ